MSHSSFSIFAVPMILSKKVFSTFCAMFTLRPTMSMSSFPNLLFWFCANVLFSTWRFSMSRAWSCRFSTWP